MRSVFTSFMVFAIGIPCQAGLAAAIEIVHEGKPSATVVLAPDASQQLKSAVDILRQTVAEASGAQLHMAQTAPTSGNVIYIGRGSWLSEFDINQGDLDEDGFEILFPDDRSILILGPTDWGTEYGIDEFLEQYVGVRWLMPGPYGVSVPNHQTIDVPRTPVRQQPAFFSRSISGIKDTGEDGRAWYRTLRLRSRIQFHHQLVKLFPPQAYRDTHPEFFPEIDGKRRPPRDNSDYKWQPCFSSPAVVEEAIQNISRYFDENPTASSYSLGINDTRSEYWCQCDACRSAYSGKTNRAGMPDYSDVYYAWCDKVVEGVLKKHPDKWFGCLAYNNVFDPPSKVKIHPRLIPYITEDRMQWIDPQRREQGHNHLLQWQEASPNLGWYDYFYGRQYALPRVYFHEMADYLRYGAQHGVRAFYAEGYPNPGEGPKFYLAAKLLWNPNADVDALLNDWYTHCAGEEAAADLAQFYRHWEDFWTRRVLKSSWFGDSSSPDYHLQEYLDFQSQDYLDLVELPEMTQCRRWLESALAKAPTPRHKARVQLLLKAFDGYEDAVFFHYINTAQQPAEQVLARLLHDDPSGRTAKMARDLMQILKNKIPAASKNPSFEETDGNGPQSWNLWVATQGSPPHGVIEWSAGSAAHSGGKYLTLRGVKRGGPVQQIPARPGRYVMLATCRLSSQSTDQSVEMTVHLKNDRGQNLNDGNHQENVSVQLKVGQWLTIARSFVVTQSIGNMDISTVQFALIIESRQPQTVVDCDDIGIYPLPE